MRRTLIGIAALLLTISARATVTSMHFEPPPGLYDVVVAGGIGRDTGTLQQTLIVREIGSLRFDRAAVPISGSRIGVTDLGVCLYSFRGLCASAISFDGSAFASIENGVVNVPPHAAGTVDVTIEMFDNSRQTLRAAITYYDPAATPDLALFEPILFPIAYNGDGAFGSQWATENALDLINTGAVFRSPVDLDASRPEGLLLWAFRGTANEVNAQSRVRETTRNDMGVEVPVVHDRDFRHPSGDFTGRRAPQAHRPRSSCSPPSLTTSRTGRWSASRTMQRSRSRS